MKVGGVVTTVYSVKDNTFAVIRRSEGAVITWLGASAATDILITTSLVWSLVRYPCFMIPGW